MGKSIAGTLLGTRCQAHLHGAGAPLAVAQVRVVLAVARRAPAGMHWLRRWILALQSSAVCSGC